MPINPMAKSLRIDPENPKYALIKLRRLNELTDTQKDQANDALEVLRHLDVLDRGDLAGNEFFVLRLKDQYSDDALYRYSLSARYDGETDYALQIEELANHAGNNHPNCKKPD